MSIPKQTSLLKKASWFNDIDKMGVVTSGIGIATSAVGSLFSAMSRRSTLQFQSRMAELNAQSIRAAGERAIGNVGLRQGKVRSSQKASQAARGIALGEGSAAEEIATTDLMAETDKWTINANMEREAANAQAQGLMAGASASSINPVGEMTTDLLGSATAVAPSWYKIFKKIPDVGNY
jgi:hypothetical protein